MCHELQPGITEGHFVSQLFSLVSFGGKEAGVGVVSRHAILEIPASKGLGYG